MDQSSDVNSDHYYMEFVESSMSPAKDSSPYDDMEIEGSLTPKKPLMSPNDSDKPFKRHKPESNKGRPKQSFVWNYFITEDDSNYCQVTVPVSLKYPEGKCNHKLKSGTTTTNMINHLSKIHGIKNYTEEERLKAQGQKVINIQFPTLNEDQKFYLKKKYLKFLIDCGHQLELSKCEYFKEFVTTLNPLFEVPTDESLSYLAVNLYDIAIDALKKIFQKTDKICLTCNFWKSKGHGIIVITANWISDDYKHQEAFLTLEEIDFPFTPISIKKKIREIIHEWNISNKVSFITTENSARMIEAIKLLGGELNVERISCVSHTLQLVIGKALNVNQNIQIFILRVKRLVHFFSTPKQLESLIEAQEALHYTMVYEMVSEIPTRWNSSYHSWEKLLILRRDLTYLCNETNSGRDVEERDALKRIMLSVDEWDLMDHLVKILGKFEEITRLLDGSNYITMSLVYPMILTLKSHIKEMLAKYQNGQSSRDPYMNADSFFDDVITDIQNEILNGFQEISTNVEADVVCIEGKGSKQVLNISEPIKVDGLVISVLETLDIALNKYWSVSSDVGLFATILDPRTKKLKKFTEAERHRAIALLIDRYEIYNVNDNDENKSELQNDADLLNNKSIMNMIMEDEESSDEEEENEINIYLKNKANRDILPLIWWENNEKKFTFLSKMAKEYLAIPVTSTDSTESSFGIINNTNNCMPPKKFYFLKKNSNLLKIYD